MHHVTQPSTMHHVAEPSTMHHVAEPSTMHHVAEPSTMRLKVLATLLPASAIANTTCLRPAVDRRDLRLRRARVLHPHPPRGMHPPRLLRRVLQLI